MVERYYFDTSIWLDIFEQRERNGKIAKKLIQKIIEEDSVVVYSDMVVMELANLGYSQQEINRILNIAKPDHILRVHITKLQYKEGKTIARKKNIPHGDAIHAIIARDTESCLISRDGDFQKIKEIARAYLPEGLC
jgi:predicted nucleic acid-binding protein